MIINNNMFAKAGIPLFERLLKVVSAGQKLTASNIANVSTPGYQTKHADFKEEMKNFLSEQRDVAVQTTDTKHIRLAAPERAIRATEAEDSSNSSGINGVDIEKEMATLAEQQIMYEFGARKLSKMFNILRMAIRGKST